MQHPQARSETDYPAGPGQEGAHLSHYLKERIPNTSLHRQYKRRLEKKGLRPLMSEARTRHALQDGCNGAEILSKGALHDCLDQAERGSQDASAAIVAIGPEIANLGASTWRVEGTFNRFGGQAGPAIWTWIQSCYKRKNSPASMSLSVAE